MKKEFALLQGSQRVHLHSQKRGEVFDYAAATIFLESFLKYRNSRPGEIESN